MNVVRRAKAPHPGGGQSRPATVVPAIMLSIQLCGVRPENPCRITLLAKFTPHNSSAGPVSGTRAQRRIRLAGPLLRAFRPAARRRVRSPDRPLRSPRPGRARRRVPPLTVPASSAQAAGGWLRWGGASARIRLVRRAWRSLDSSPTRGPERPGVRSAAATGSAPSAPRHPRRRGVRAGFMAGSRSLARFANCCSRASPGRQAQPAAKHPAAACQRHPRPSKPAPCRAAGRACGHGRPR